LEQQNTDSQCVCTAVLFKTQALFAYKQVNTYLAVKQAFVSVSIPISYFKELNSLLPPAF
jgi:hypothetical protein